MGHSTRSKGGKAVRLMEAFLICSFWGSHVAKQEERIDKHSDDVYLQLNYTIVG